MVEFNLASDVLELLDEAFLAPRIHGNIREPALVYPLPVRSPAISETDHFSPENIFKICENSGFNPGDAELNLDDGFELTLPSGSVRISDGRYVASGFAEHDLPRASYLVSTLCYFFDPSM